MTFEEMCELEPELGRLRDDVAAVVDDGKSSWFCANRVWLREFKPRLVDLVGLMANVEALRTSKAYDVAYKAIYQLLPACRNCTCM